MLVIVYFLWFWVWYGVWFDLIWVCGCGWFGDCVLCGCVVYWLCELWVLLWACVWGFIALVRGRLDGVRWFLLGSSLRVAGL